jgi:hypothetical protein
VKKTAARVTEFRGPSLLPPAPFSFNELAHGPQHINSILHLPLVLPYNPHTPTSPEKRVQQPVLTPILNNPMSEPHASLCHPKKLIETSSCN